LEELSTQSYTTITAKASDKTKPQPLLSTVVMLQPDSQTTAAAVTAVHTQLWQEDKAYATLLGSVLEDMRVYR
jgi:hypothetical protein